MPTDTAKHYALLENLWTVRNETSWKVIAPWVQTDLGVNPTLYWLCDLLIHFVWLPVSLFMYKWWKVNTTIHLKVCHNRFLMHIFFFLPLLLPSLLLLLFLLFPLSFFFPSPSSSSLKGIKELKNSPDSQK